MAIEDTFSKRTQRAEGTAPDVYRYDELPQKLRIQFIQTAADAIGELGSNGANLTWRKIYKAVLLEHGRTQLDHPSETPFAGLHRAMIGAKLDFGLAMDIVELTLRAIEQGGSGQAVLDEVNIRFRENSVGYRFAGGQLVRMDSEVAHAGIVLPAISLLNSKGFEGPNEEYMRAHTHYRAAEYEPAIVEAGKAFESTLKTICAGRGWPFDASKLGAAHLIDVVINNGLIPKYMHSHLSGLRTTLRDGLPTLRNQDAAHGSGTEVREVEEHYAAYALHLAAANILMLVRAHEALK